MCENNPLSCSDSYLYKVIKINLRGIIIIIWKIIQDGIGWSKHAWCYPLRLFIANNPKCNFEKSLEIGASEHGSLAPFLLEVSNKITIGYFQCDIAKLNNNLSAFNCDTEAQYVDITNIDGKYDLIIAKSVLGGGF